MTVHILNRPYKVFPKNQEEGYLLEFSNPVVLQYHYDKT